MLHFGARLGHVWGTLGALLGHFWALLGNFWDTFGHFWNACGALLGYAWDTLWKAIWKEKRSRSDSEQVFIDNQVETTFSNGFATCSEAFWGMILFVVPQ